MRPKTNLNAPPPKPQKLLVQLHLAPGPLQDEILAIMAKMNLTQAAACRVLMSDGLEARNGKRVA